MPPTVDGAFARWLAERVGQMLLALRTEVGFADPARYVRPGISVRTI